MVDCSDCVILLPNASESEGAMLEKKYAEYIGKTVLKLDVKNETVIYDWKNAPNNRDAFPKEWSFYNELI